MNDIEYPLTVSSIKVDGDMGVRKESLFAREPGTWVKIRPCDPECKDKTYLGIYIGAIPLSLCIKMGKAVGGGAMTISPSFHNPAIWVPDLKRVVMGCESWWGEIKSPDDIKEITDSDIDNCWYVKALKEHFAKTAKKTPKTNDQKTMDLVKQVVESDATIPARKRNKSKRKGTR